MQHWPETPAVIPRRQGSSSSLQPAELGVGPAVWTWGDPVGECPECHVAGDAAAAFAGVPASASVDVHGGAAAVEAQFEEPVGCGWPVCDALLSFCFPPFGCCDCFPYCGELEGEPGLDGAEAGEVGWEVLHAASLPHYSNTRSNRCMATRSDLDVLAALGIDPHALEPGPDDVVRAPGWQARVYPDSPDRKGCSACGQPATFTRLLPLPGLGPRWVDECRDHMIAACHLRAGQ